MQRGDEENLSLATTAEHVDKLNKAFYERYPFPWPAMKFDYLTDPALETILLNQSLGDWQHNTVPINANIWVAGCGTNQAIVTALKFPQATILGSDISVGSLNECSRIAEEIGITNLEVKAESINEISYQNKFDYILCTGVIHHMADPQAALLKLAAALKPTGILELMVHNRFHRINLATLQKAVRILKNSRGIGDFAEELIIAKEILGQKSLGHPLSKFYEQLKDLPEPLVADGLIQPVEHSYTVESLNEMANQCGLELMIPCPNAMDKMNAASWYIEFDLPQLQKLYDALPDQARWQVTNLLLLEKSPALWFYLQRKDSGRPRKSEKQICEEFLQANPAPISTTQRSYVQGADGSYMLSPEENPFPVNPAEDLLRDIIQEMNGRVSMKNILSKRGISSTPSSIGKLRSSLTTTMYPYAKVVC
jgi:SAM-dependent methyltransferase